MALWSPSRNYPERVALAAAVWSASDCLNPRDPQKTHLSSSDRSPFNRINQNNQGSTKQTIPGGSNQQGTLEEHVHFSTWRVFSAARVAEDGHVARIAQGPPGRAEPKAAAPIGGPQQRLPREDQWPALVLGTKNASPKPKKNTWPVVLR